MVQRIDKPKDEFPWRGREIDHECRLSRLASDLMFAPRCTPSQRPVNAVLGVRTVNALCGFRLSACAVTANLSGTQR